MKSSVLTYMPGVNVPCMEVEGSSETFVVYSRDIQDIQKCIIVQDCAGAKLLCVLHKNGTVEGL